MNENDRKIPLIERQKSQSQAHADAWSQLLDEMNELAADREDDGWDVITVVSDHTNTIARDEEEERPWGLSHIVPESDATAFEEFYDPETFTEYLAYGRRIEGYMYLVTEFIDPTNDRSAFIASRYDVTHAKGVANSAESAGVLYTHVQKIDGTVVGSFEHEDYRPLLGQPSD